MTTHPAKLEICKVPLGTHQQSLMISAIQYNDNGFQRMWRRVGRWIEGDALPTKRASSNSEARRQCAIGALGPPSLTPGRTRKQQSLTDKSSKERRHAKRHAFWSPEKEIFRVCDTDRRQLSSKWTSDSVTTVPMWFGYGRRQIANKRSRNYATAHETDCGMASCEPRAKYNGAISLRLGVAAIHWLGFSGRNSYHKAGCLDNLRANACSVGWVSRPTSHEVLYRGLLTRWSTSRRHQIWSADDGAQPLLSGISAQLKHNLNAQL